MRFIPVLCSALLAFLALTGHARAATSMERRCQVFPAPDPAARVIAVPTIPAEGDCSIKGAIKSILVQGKPEKGEFETAAAYKDRLGRLMSAEIQPGLKLSSALAVAFPIDDDSLAYDADKQSFALSYGRDSFDQVCAYIRYSFDRGKEATPLDSYSR